MDETSDIRPSVIPRSKIELISPRTKVNGDSNLITPKSKNVFLNPNIITPKTKNLSIITPRTKNLSIITPRTKNLSINPNIITPRTKNTLNPNIITPKSKLSRGSYTEKRPRNSVFSLTGRPDPSSYQFRDEDYKAKTSKNSREYNLLERDRELFPESCDNYSESFIQNFQYKKRETINFSSILELENRTDIKTLYDSKGRINDCFYVPKKFDLVVDVEIKLEPIPKIPIKITNTVWDNLLGIYENNQGYWLQEYEKNKEGIKRELINLETWFKSIIEPKKRNKVEEEERIERELVKKYGYTSYCDPEAKRIMKS
jgi:hypothetical protein